jgi:hypothetical protein
VLATVGIGWREGLAGCAIVARKQAHRPWARLSGESQAELGMRDPAREHQIHGKREIVTVLEEEWPLLWEEDFESLVNRDLRLIGFDLAEVGIDGSIEHEAAVQNELCIESDVGFEITVLEERVIGVALVDVAKVANESIGNEPAVAAG